MGKILKNGISYAGGGAEGKSAYQTWLDLGNTGTEQDFLDFLGGSASINDNNISLDSTWSSVKIATETSDNYAIFEGVIGGSYYSTTIDEEDITNAPVTLYGGWTLDNVNTNFTEGSILSAFNNATKRKRLSLTEDVRIGEMYSDYFSVYDDTMSNGGNPYKIILLWDNEDSGISIDDGIIEDTSAWSSEKTVTEMLKSYDRYVRIKGVSGGRNEYSIEITELDKAYKNPPYDLGYDWQITEVKTSGGLLPSEILTELFAEIDDYCSNLISVGGTSSLFGDSMVHFNTGSGNTPFEVIFAGNLTKPVVVDEELDIESTNAIQNKAVAEALATKGTVYTSLAELGLTADATLNDVIATMPKGSRALLGVTEFTNYQTIFPYEEGNDQFGRVYIVKGNDIGRTYAKWFRKDGAKEAIAIMNINDNQITGWQKVGIRTYTTLEELGLDASATLNDAINAMPFSSSALLGVTMFTDYQTIFPYAETNDQYSRVYIVKSDSLSRVYIVWFNKNGSKYAIANVDGNNKVVGWNNILTQKSDPYTCSTYTPLTGTEDLFTLPCGHYVSANINTTYNYPITDTNTTAHIYVLGCLNDPANNKGYRIILYFDNKGRAYRINEWWGVFTDNRWQEIAKKTIYNSVAELNRAKGTNIELVNGEDNTKKIVDALSVGEQFVSFYHNNANQNRFGIDVSYGSLIHELRISKCLDADLTANYATVTAFMDTGCVMSRIYYKTYSTDWSSTKDYVESLLANS